MSDDFQFRLTPHCCRICFSRVLVRETFDRRKVYRCAGCGVEKEGSSPAVICSCGIKLKTNVDAGIRCHPSENKTPEFPAEVVCSVATIPIKSAL